MTEDRSIIEDIKKTFGPALEIQPLLSQLILREVRLLESSNFLKVSSDEFKITNIEQNIYIEPRQNLETSVIALVFHLKLKGKSDADEEMLRVAAKYGAIYNLKTKEQFEDEIISKFSQFVGLNVIWPYWREFVQTMTSRMGLPPLTLPLVRPGDLQFEKTQAGDEISETEKAKT
jgi:preprotein translocase subunit SecB